MVIPTGVISYGSPVAEAFSECLSCNVQGIPFVDREGRITGQFSVRETIKHYCISHTMIKDADFLGDDLGPLTLKSTDAAEMLSQPVDHFILPEVVTIHSDAPCIKAMALMEKHNTTFLFVVDSDTYKGIVNVQAIARWFMKTAGL